MLFDLASHLHKTVYELEHLLSIDELCEWLAWFDLKKNPEPPAPLADDPDRAYNAMRNVLN